MSLLCAYVAGFALFKISDAAFRYFRTKKKIKELYEMAETLGGGGERAPSEFSFFLEYKDGRRERLNGVRGSATFEEDCKHIRIKLLELAQQLERDL